MTWLRKHATANGLHRKLMTLRFASEQLVHAREWVTFRASGEQGGAFQSHLQTGGRGGGILLK